MYLLQYGKQLRENYRAFKNKQQVDSMTCSVPSVSVAQQHSQSCALCIMQEMYMIKIKWYSLL